jgi:hypothetical protein
MYVEWTGLIDVIPGGSHRLILIYCVCLPTCFPLFSHSPVFLSFPYSCPSTFTDPAHPMTTTIAALLSFFCPSGCWAVPREDWEVRSRVWDMLSKSSPRRGIGYLGRIRRYFGLGWRQHVSIRIWTLRSCSVTRQPNSSTIFGDRTQELNGFHIKCAPVSIQWSDLLCLC